MRALSIAGVLAVLAMIATGCASGGDGGGGGGGDLDTGPFGPRDTGPMIRIDAGPFGPRDSGPMAPRDAGPFGPRDAGPGMRDAGRPRDSGPTMGPRDSGPMMTFPDTGPGGMMGFCTSTADCASMPGTCCFRFDMTMPGICTPGMEFMGYCFPE